MLYDVPRSSRDKDNPAYTLCPRPWEPADVDPIQSASDLVTARYEMTFFRPLAEVWNRRPQPWDTFPQFLRVVYAERVQRAAPVEETADDEPWLVKFPVRTREMRVKAA